MKVTEFKIQGPKLIELKHFADERGFFVERFRQNLFSEIGIKDLVQDNFSRSIPKVLRGLHYQFDKPQSKLVTAISGRILDVIVDIRHNSPTYGQHISVELDGTKPQWFWVPAGFAHGFLVLGNQEADVMYKVDNYWNGAGENGIAWNDPALGIQWPINDPIVSSKDQILQKFSDYQKDPKF